MYTMAASVSVFKSDGIIPLPVWIILHLALSEAFSGIAVTLVWLFNQQSHSASMILRI